LDYSPDILQIRTSLDTSTSSVRVDLRVESACTVFCGRFLANSDPDNVHSVGIRLQHFFQFTSTNDAVLHMDGLVANVAYDLYCMTTTLDDKFEMSTAHILETRSPITMPCCREDFAMDLLSKYQPASRYSISAITIYFGIVAPVYQEVRIGIHLIPVHLDLFEGISLSGRRLLSDNSSTSNFTMSDCLNGISVYPNSFAVPSNLLVAYEQVIFIGSVCSGEFQLNVTAHESDANNVNIYTRLPITFPNGNIVNVQSSENVFPSPILQSALYILSGEIVELRFDSFTDMGKLGGTEFACSRLLEFAEALSAVCSWKSSTRLRVVSGVSHLSLNDNITLL
jgi:hypothetical protein